MLHSKLMGVILDKVSIWSAYRKFGVNFQLIKKLISRFECYKTATSIRFTGGLVLCSA